MEARGHAYFEDTLRIGRVFDLLNQPARAAGVRGRESSPTRRGRSNGACHELIDWLVEQDFRQWQAMTSRWPRGSASTGDASLGGAEIGSFHADRSRLIDSVGRQAQRVVDTYDKRREASAIADGAHAAVAATRRRARALGLGTLVTLAASTAAADVTGILTASVLATLGLLVIPAKRRRARAEMRAKVTALRARLGEALRSHSRRRRSGEPSDWPTAWRRTRGSFEPNRSVGTM